MCQVGGNAFPYHFGRRRLPRTRPEPAATTNSSYWTGQEHWGIDGMSDRAVLTEKKCVVIFFLCVWIAMMIKRKDLNESATKSN